MSPATLPANSDARTSGYHESRGRVLIVDDEEVIASTLKEFLQGEAYEVATAMTMSSALSLVASFEPDVVLCDVQLPGGDGLTLLNRALQTRPETLFIMITAYATVENAVAAFQRGAHDYLMKPVMFEELLVKIDRLMKYRRLLLENQTLRRQFHAHEDLDTLVGRSPAIQAVKTLIRKVGPTRSTVLITGESGTGKELAARAFIRSGPTRTPYSWLSTVRRSPTICWRTSSSATSGRLHRGRSRSGRAVRRGGPRNGLPRRDWRAEQVNPGQAAAGDREQGCAARRRDPDRLFSGPAGSRDQQGSPG